MNEEAEKMNLTSEQRRNLVACRIQEDPRSHHVFAALRMKGPLDVRRLTQALHNLRRRHDAMRAVATDADATEFSLVPATESVPLEVEAIAGDVNAWLERAVSERFDHSQPWGRVRLGRSKDEYALLLALPGAACDGKGMERLLKEVVHGYARAANDSTTSAPLDAGDGLQAYLRLVNADDQWQEHLSAAKERLAGELPPLELPVLAHRPPVFTGYGKLLRSQLSRSAKQRLDAMATELEIAWGDLLVTTYIAVLQRWCNQDEFTLGMYGPSRPWDGVAPVEGVGVLRIQLDPHVSVSDAARQVGNLARQVRAAMNVPFSALVQAVSPARDASRTPLFQAAVAPMPALMAPRTIDEVTFEQHVFSNVGARTDVTLCVSTEPDGLELGLEFAVDVVPETTAQQLLDAVVRGLEALPDSQEKPVGRLALLSERELAQSRCALTLSEYDASRPAYVRFEEHADAQPDAVAVVMNDTSCTYGELERRANRLAHRLRHAGVEHETLVGIYCERSIDMLVALLATHKAGGAYVPLDPAHPNSRVQVIVEDAAPRVLVTQQALVDRCPAPEDCTVIAVDESDGVSTSDERPTLEVKPDGLAYVIFTSGSTGRPKGVEIAHRAFTNFLTSMAHTPGMTNQDRILSVTTLSFDIAGLELLLPLFVGGSVEICDRTTCVDPQRLSHRASDPSLTIMQATPATWRMLLDSGWRGNPRLKILCGGEPFPPDLVAAVLQRTAEVWNMYGPTETTVWSTVQRLHDNATPIPIGRPIDNTSVYLLNPCGEPVPQGAVGEIWIGGHGVARGYRGRTDLTQERFVPDPFVQQPGARMYKTGDLGRLREDGLLLCLGRVDFQVKIRGFRIELGDIEAAILQHPRVKEAVAVAREEQAGDKRLVAYVVTEGNGDVGAELRQQLKDTLPGYMIPSAFVRLETMPLNPSGKIDRKALPAPSATDAEAPEEVAELTDDLEAVIEAVFLQVLGVRSVNVETSFFDAGGDSLLAVRLVRQLEEALGTSVPLALLFEASSVRALAKALRDEPIDPERPRVVLLRGGTSDAKLFCVYGVALYQHLARAMPEHLSVYGVFVPVETQIFAEERLARGELQFPQVEELAHLYINVIRDVQPKGPYRIVGVSFGGVVAYEIACQLRAAGEEVVLLGLLDALLPQAVGGGRIKEWLRKGRDIVLRGHARSAVARLVRARLGKPSTTPWSEAELEWLRDQVHELQVGRYASRLRKYDGAAVIVHARDRQGYAGKRVDAAAGWKDAVAGGVVEFQVPGDHLEIVAPPNVNVLAEQLRPHL